MHILHPSILVLASVLTTCGLVAATGCSQRSETSVDTPGAIEEPAKSKAPSAADRPTAPTTAVATDIPPGIAMPDEIDTRLGKLTFVDGAPTDDTAQKVFDNLDFTRALDAYLKHPGDTARDHVGEACALEPPGVKKEEVSLGHARTLLSPQPRLGRPTTRGAVGV